MEKIIRCKGILLVMCGLISKDKEVLMNKHSKLITNIIYNRPFNEMRAMARESVGTRPIRPTRSTCRARKLIDFIASER